MKVKDLDFNLTYVLRVDTLENKKEFFAFNVYEDAIDFIEFDGADKNAEEERYFYCFVDGELEITTKED